MDDAGLEGVPAGLSAGKKLDLLLRGEGEGGICDSVSMVRSDKEGLGRRRASTSLVGPCSGWLPSSTLLILENCSSPLALLVSFRDFGNGVSPSECPCWEGPVVTSDTALGRPADFVSPYLDGILGIGGSNTV